MPDDLGALIAAGRFGVVVLSARSADDEILDRLAARGVLQRGTGKPVLKPIRQRKRGESSPTS